MSDATKLTKSMRWGESPVFILLIKYIIPAGEYTNTLSILVSYAMSQERKKKLVEKRNHQFSSPNMTVDP